jgi:UDP-3-O-[3-hydroxymyristoyl] glucosamine N-acyltransferase
MDSVVSFRSSHRDIGTLPWLSVGKNNFINETVVFAHDGFGYEKIDGKWLLIPHTGRIRIGEDVHIHAFTVVCPGTGDNDETVIGDGTKIDTRCHIAHNVKIGKNCLITSGVTIGGSAEIGDDVYIGIGALIRNKIKIGKGAIIGMGAVVVTDVPEGITVVGNPAKPI